MPTVPGGRDLTIDGRRYRRQRRPWAIPCVCVAARRGCAPMPAQAGQAGSRTVTTASACWPNRRSPTLRSAAIRARRRAGPAGTIRNAQRAVALGLEDHPRGRRKQRPPLGDDERHVGGLAAAERIAHLDLDVERRARVDLALVRLDPGAEALRAEVDLLERQQLAVDARDLAAAALHLVQPLGRDGPRGPVAADHEVRREVAVQLRAAHEVVDPEPVAVLVVERLGRALGRPAARPAGRRSRAPSARPPRARSRRRTACGRAARGRAARTRATGAAPRTPPRGRRRWGRATGRAGRSGAARGRSGSCSRATRPRSPPPRAGG